MIELNLENIDSVFITSDLHLNHKNIIKYCNRPWEFSDEGLEEMNHFLISNLMQIPVVCTLLNLGDWAMLSHGNTNRFMVRNVIADLLNKALAKLIQNEDEYKKYDSPNGWGTTQGVIKLFTSMRDYWNILDSEYKDVACLRTS